MKRMILICFARFFLMLAGSNPATAQQRYIVVSTGGLSSVLNLCGLLGCQVQGNLDGTVGRTFLVPSTNILSTVVNLVESLLGIVSIEPDKIVPAPQTPLPNIPAGLYDPSPGNYYGTSVWHGYAAQPAAQILRLADAPNGFAVARCGIVGVIDTVVDPNPPALYPVPLPGYRL